MTPLEILGWVAASFGMASALPQLLRLLSTRSSAGVSLAMFQLNAASTGAWALHGFMVAVPQMQYPNMVLTLSSFAVCVLVLKDRRQPMAAALFLPLLLSVALFSVDVWLGPLIFGFVVAAPFVVGQVSQLKTMFSTRDISGVSLPFLAFALGVQSLWLTWGLLYGETSITVCASLLGTLSLVNLVYYVSRLARGMVSPSCEPLVEQGLAAAAPAVNSTM